MIKVIKTEENFVSFKQEWDDLYSELQFVTPYQSHSFNYHNWNILERTTGLYILCIYRQKDMQLQAIFPCVLSNRGVLQFINGVHSDFCSALIREEVRRDYHFYKEFADYIKQTSEIKGFMFDNLKGDNYLLAIMECFFKGMQTRISNKWSFFEIKACDVKDGGFINSMLQLTSKDRYRLKNVLKKAQTTELIFFGINKSAYPKFIVNDIINTMLSSGTRTEAYFSDDFKNVLEYLYNDGLLSIAVTFEKDNPLVANLFLIHGNEYIDWLAIYKDGRLNTTNLLQVIEHIYNRGGGIFNFARGLYDYKVSNFRPEIHNLYRIEYAKNRMGQFNILISFYKYYLKVFLRPILKR